MRDAMKRTRKYNRKIRGRRGVGGGGSGSRKRVYTKKDYESGDGMVTSIWGPGMWHFCHTMSFNYPVHPTAQQKKDYRDFVYSLQNILPCGKCRENLKKNMNELPLKMEEHMKSRETFSKYMYDLHEHVNKMLGKKSGLTYNDVRERYEHFRARCTQPENKDAENGGGRRRARTPTKKHEKGCTVPLYGQKAKCILKIVPETTKCNTLEIDKKCEKQHTPIA